MLPVANRRRAKASRLISASQLPASAALAADVSLRKIAGATVYPFFFVVQCLFLVDHTLHRLPVTFVDGISAGIVVFSPISSVFCLYVGNFWCHWGRHFHDAAHHHEILVCVISYTFITSTQEPSCRSESRSCFLGLEECLVSRRWNCTALPLICFYFLFNEMDLIKKTKKHGPFRCSHISQKYNFIT